MDLCAIRRIFARQEIDRRYGENITSKMTMTSMQNLVRRFANCTEDNHCGKINYPLTTICTLIQSIDEEPNDEMAGFKYPSNLMLWQDHDYCNVYQIIIFDSVPKAGRYRNANVVLWLKDCLISDIKDEIIPKGEFARTSNL